MNHHHTKRRASLKSLVSIGAAGTLGMLNPCFLVPTTVREVYEVFVT